jgi:hypothetical protein
VLTWVSAGLGFAAVVLTGNSSIHSGTTSSIHGYGREPERVRYRAGFKQVRM